jgi:hypothetical protein
LKAPNSSSAKLAWTNQNPAAKLRLKKVNPLEATRLDMALKTRKRGILLAAIATLLVAFAAFLVVLQSGNPPNPRYQGKSLDRWVRQLPETLRYTNLFVSRRPTLVGDRIEMVVQHRPPSAGSTQMVRESIEAVQKIGTNGVPLLLGELQARDSAFTQRVQGWALKLHLKKSWFRTADEERRQAALALIALQPLPEPWTERVRALARDSRTEVASAAKLALAARLSYDTNRNMPIVVFSWDDLK